MPEDRNNLVSVDCRKACCRNSFSRHANVRFRCKLRAIVGQILVLGFTRRRNPCRTTYPATLPVHGSRLRATGLLIFLAEQVLA